MATNGASVRFDRAPDGSGVRCVVTVTDPEFLGHAATLRVTRKTDVHDSRPVNASHTLLTHEIPFLRPRSEIVFANDLFQAYSYRGSNLDIEIHSELEIDDGILFDTTITEEEQVEIGIRPATTTDPKEIIDPSDAFDFTTNLQAIPPQNRLITLCLVFIALIVLGFNSLVGVHDQISAEQDVWLYHHRDSDGDSESPFFTSLAVSGVAGGLLWLAIRRQLRTYMTLEICNLPGTIDRSTKLPLRAIFRGRSRVPLDGARLRIVACNMEKGQYRRGSGTNQRTVSFSEPVLAVVLFDQVIDRLPAGVPVEQYFEGDLSFEPMFRALYPPQMISSTHGLALCWEAQLIHDELVDQELAGPIDCFSWKEFLQA